MFHALSERHDRHPLSLAADTPRSQLPFPTCGASKEAQDFRSRRKLSDACSAGLDVSDVPPQFPAATLLGVCQAVTESDLIGSQTMAGLGSECVVSGVGLDVCCEGRVALAEFLFFQTKHAR